jgi:hypothetical protein
MGKKQRGFFLVQIALGITILLFLAALGAQKYVSSVRDSAAESTGRYLFTVRTAVIKALSTYDAAFTRVDTSTAPPGVYPVPPAWAVFSGTEQTLSVKDLKDSALLSNSFPDTPPAGRSAHVKILRTGVCPGDTCKLDAYVYTCWPISDLRPAGAVVNTTCPVAPAGTEFDANMVGAVIGATDGYGATNYFAPATMRGALFSVPMTSLGLPANSPGHVAVLATLNDASNSQFVRQGDTRHIYLKDSLTVSKQVSAGEGLLLPTNSVVGGICTAGEGAYGTSTRNSPVICTGGRWFELVNHILLSSQSLPNGAAIVPPSCPGANMQPFAYVSLQNSDVTMTGGDISITGVLGGGITGTGNVSSAGTVSVSGTFNGTTTSGPGSSIRVAQGVSLVGNTVVITPATANARALVMQGCRYL